MKADSISLLQAHVQRGASARLPTPHGEFEQVLVKPGERVQAKELLIVMRPLA